MLRPTQALVDEHGIIEGALVIIESICDRMEAGMAVEPVHLRQILEFIKEFADRYHHAKEEDLLFPAMVAAGFPKEGGPIAVMLYEHELGRGYVRGMEAGIVEYESGNGHEGFTTNARAYIELLRAHIKKENDILYRIAENLLSEEDKRSLLEDFAKVDKQHEDKSQYFKEVLTAIEKSYG